MTSCAEPGCPNLVERGYCATHSRERRQASDARRPSARQRGYDSAWDKTRRSYLLEHPVCEDESGCSDAATDVHHLDGLGPLGPRGHDPDNLQALCHSHHSRITMREQPGGFAA